jgi:hypothetical protein
MSIPFKNFEKWAKEKFGDDAVKVSGNEIKINSIFESDDDGHHLWCNPDGGKKKHKFGAFNCWKSNRKGSLVKLVMMVEGCDRDEAVAKLMGTQTIRELERDIEAIFAASDGYSFDEEVKTSGPAGLSLPEGSMLISALPAGNWWRSKAQTYLEDRKIPTDGLYVCTEGRYKYRIVIPYIGRRCEVTYFNCRHMGDSKCKYLGPPKDIGVGKEDVVFMAGPWPDDGETVYICEGEFNAMSMRQAEFHAAACGGKSMSEKQAILLSPYKTVICLDRDRAGRAGTLKMSSMVTALGTGKKSKDSLGFVIPPVGYNDWNQFLKEKNAVMLHHYVTKNTRPLDYSGPIGTTGDFFGFSDLWR